MQEKKKTPIVAIIIIITLIILIAAAVVAVLLILPKDGGPDSKTDDSSTSIKKEEEKKQDKQEGVNNPGIIAASAANGNIADHTRGKRDSKVMVLEYADPQCPGCAMMMPIMNEIYEKYKDEVVFVYRHYTIAGHQNAVSAAIAIEAAGKQGYFWEMLELMFSKRVDWISKSGTNLTIAYVDIFKEASDNKGDVAQFKQDLNDANLKKKVDFDKNKGISDELYATPTIIVNGEEVDIMSAYDLKQAIIDKIEAALAK